MICGSCGTENLAGRTYCGHCDKPMRPDREQVVAAARVGAIAQERERLGRSLVTYFLLAIGFFIAAVAFRVSFRERDLPRFSEIPVAPVLDRLPMSDSEYLSHPWILLPIPKE